MRASCNINLVDDDFECIEAEVAIFAVNATDVEINVGACLTEADHGRGERG